MASIYNIGISVRFSFTKTEGFCVIFDTLESGCKIIFEKSVIDTDQGSASISEIN